MKLQYLKVPLFLFLPCLSNKRRIVLTGLSRIPLRSNWQVSPTFAGDPAQTFHAAKAGVFPAFFCCLSSGVGEKPSEVIHLKTGYLCFELFWKESFPINGEVQLTMILWYPFGFHMFSYIYLRTRMIKIFESLLVLPVTVKFLGHMRIWVRIWVPELPALLTEVTKVQAERFKHFGECSAPKFI